MIYLGVVFFVFLVSGLCWASCTVSVGLSCSSNVERFWLLLLQINFGPYTLSLPSFRNSNQAPWSCPTAHWYSVPPSLLFFSLCFILGCFYYYAFKFTNLFFCSVNSVDTPIQCLFCFVLTVGIPPGSFLQLSCLPNVLNFPLFSWTYGI